MGMDFNNSVNPFGDFNSPSYSPDSFDFDLPEQDLKPLENTEDSFSKAGEELEKLKEQDQKLNEKEFEKMLESDKQKDLEAQKLFKKLEKEKKEANRLFEEQLKAQKSTKDQFQSSKDPALKKATSQEQQKLNKLKQETALAEKKLKELKDKQKQLAINNMQSTEAASETLAKKVDATQAKLPIIEQNLTSGLSNEEDLAYVKTAVAERDAHLKQVKAEAKDTQARSKYLRASAEAEEKKHLALIGKLKDSNSSEELGQLLNNKDYQDKTSQGLIKLRMTALESERNYNSSKTKYQTIRDRYLKAKAKREAKDNGKLEQTIRESFADVDDDIKKHDATAKLNNKKLDLDTAKLEQALDRDLDGDGKISKLNDIQNKAKQVENARTKLKQILRSDEEKKKTDLEKQLDFSEADSEATKTYHKQAIAKAKDREIKLEKQKEIKNKLVEKSIITNKANKKANSKLSQKDIEQKTKNKAEFETSNQSIDDIRGKNIAING